jgi:plastocyanin
MNQVRWAAVFIAVYLLQIQPAWAGGMVSGVVRYQGERPSAKRRPVTTDASVCGPEAVDEAFVLGKREGLRNAVVYLQGRVEGARSFPEPEGGFVLDQKHCRFEPHVLVAGAGSQIAVLNADHLNHNLKTVSRTNPPLEIAQPKSVFRAMLRIDHPEIVELRCGIHDWMSAWIVVAEHPYYAVTDADGRFEIKDIPAGDYTLALWHESLGLETKGIRVREGETVKINWSPRRPSAYSTPQEPFISRSAGRLDVNVIPIQIVQCSSFECP